MKLVFICASLGKSNSVVLLGDSIRSEGAVRQTLAGTDLGKNFVLGICVSLMALTFDLAVMSWSERKKRLLGL